MRRLIYRQFSILLILLVLSACSTGYAPVSEISSSQSVNNSRIYAKRVKVKSVPSSYKVAAGDTLYSIAWKYGLDFKSLAKLNNINSQYIIRVGQVLKIKKSSKANDNINRNYTVSVKSNKNTSSATLTNDKTSIKAANKTSTKKVNSDKKTTLNNSLARGLKLVWKHPAKGRIIKKFNNENKGIDYFGQQGDSVYAAASGQVVYAGNGIIGYGNLIIIKHSAEYLSAYAHNSVILTTENKIIKEGEKIAEIGSTGTTKTMLHFEIRKDGKPVDPLKYLPKK